MISRRRKRQTKLIRQFQITIQQQVISIPSGSRLARGRKVHESLAKNPQVSIMDSIQKRSSEFSRAPKPLYMLELRIFSSLRACIYRITRRGIGEVLADLHSGRGSWKFSNSQSPYTCKSSEFFLVLEPIISARTRNLSKSQSLYIGQKLKILQVPETQARAQKSSKSQ